MKVRPCFIGFGEAAQAFTGGPEWCGHAVKGYDVKSLKSETKIQKAEEFRQKDVVECIDADQALDGVNTIISLVTADQALDAAKQCEKGISKGALWLDMNSVSPETKKKAAAYVEMNGGFYVDVAVMAPVYPKRLNVPLLISGVKAKDAQTRLIALGFQNTRIVGERIGQASSIKMLRSVMIKGFEALSAECAIAASRAGVLEEVFGSMGEEWLKKANYNLDRMMVHGERRAAEMEEVVKTLESLGIEPLMSRGTVSRQRAIGSLNLNPPPESLERKLSALNVNFSEAAE